MEYRPFAFLPSALDAFTRGYLECAEWCGLKDADREALELAIRPRWNNVALVQAHNDCEAFRETYATDLEASGLDDARAGHLFWLTRNGHGAGFWEYEPARKLTDGARAFGEASVTFDANSETLSFEN